MVMMVMMVMMMMILVLEIVEIVVLTEYEIKTLSLRIILIDEYKRTYMLFVLLLAMLY